jgi:hypothetical protein
MSTVGRIDSLRVVNSENPEEVSWPYFNRDIMIDLKERSI